MKFIFDFDDVLFNNTKQFKEHMYACLEKAGVPRIVAEEYYKEVREKEFSLLDFVTILFVREKIVQTSAEDVYEEIVQKCSDFVNAKLIELIKKLEKKDCYIVSNGEEKFQKDKIKRSGISSLFSQIHIVPSSKKEVIYDICDRNKNEKVIFVEDKAKFIEDIDITKCPNLTPILYDDKGLKKLTSILP